jgi:eukaryotic-like serine/threonine-protein kinase
MKCRPEWIAPHLEETLPENKSAWLVTHLSECCHCQQTLFQIAGGQAAEATISQLFSLSPEIQSESQFSEWMRNNLHPTESTAEDRDSRRNQLREAAYQLPLHPTDDPDSMGRIGSYEIVGVIGYGGMGIVYKAFDKSLHRFVAIKMLAPHLSLSGSARKRFQQEARAMAAIAHEHVVPVYAVDEHEGYPYFEMEYVTGGTLESRIREDGPLDCISVLRIARQTALALAAAHDCGMVHRDIKPANILLDRGTERVRVADFGLARISDEADQTRSGTIIGTPQYMSPEQVRGEPCDELSDLFSLGSVMYTMCTGHPPFRSHSLHGTMLRVTNETPKSIRDYAPAIPDWLEQLVMRLLEKDPRQRFDSAQSVAQIIDRELLYLVAPHRANKPDRTWARDVSHRKQLFSVMAVAALLLICLIGGWRWKMNFEEQPRTSTPTIEAYDEEEFLSLFSSFRRDVERLEASQRELDTSTYDPFRSSTMELKQSFDNLELELGSASNQRSRVGKNE